jgi:hypothetical protein
MAEKGEDLPTRNPQCSEISSDLVPELAKALISPHPSAARRE